jgi:hypothetical protein
MRYPIRRPCPILHRVATFVFYSIALQTLASPADAQTMAAHSGWRASTSGDNTIYQPEGLPAGKVFEMTIPQPRPAAGQSLNQWLTSWAQADLRQRSPNARTGTPQTTPEGLALMLVPYSDASGQSWTAVYAGTEVSGAVHFCSMISNLPAQEMRAYIHSGAALFGTAIKQARGPGGATMPSPSGGAGSPAVSAAQAPPTSGVSGSKIAGLVHEGRGMTTPTGFQYVESIDLLLSDGSAYSGLSGPPESLDVARSKQSEPQKWHAWRQQNGSIYLQVNSSWTKLDGDVVRPLPSGSALNVRLVHRTAHTFVGMGGTTGTDRITFFPDGHFERSANVLAGSGAVQAAGGFSGGASSSTNRNGTRSSSFGTSSTGGSSVTATSASSSRAGAGSATGTYRITGYTLELDSANGQVQRLIAFYPFPGKSQVFLDNATFDPN